MLKIRVCDLYNSDLGSRNCLFSQMIGSDLGSPNCFFSLMIGRYCVLKLDDWEENKSKAANLSKKWAGASGQISSSS